MLLTCHSWPRHPSPEVLVKSSSRHLRSVISTVGLTTTIPLTLTPRPRPPLPLEGDTVPGRQYRSEPVRHTHGVRQRPQCCAGPCPVVGYLSRRQDHNLPPAHRRHLCQRRTLRLRRCEILTRHHQ